MTPERREEIRKSNTTKKWGHSESAVQHVAELLDALTAAEQERDALRDQLEADRTAAADCLTAANRAIDSRHWLTEGRGCYEWNDDRWHDEFRAAALEIKASIAPMTKIAADWSGCPVNAADIARARTEWRARAEAAEARYAEAYEALRACSELLSKVGEDQWTRVGQRKYTHAIQASRVVLSSPDAQRALRIRECERAVEDYARELHHSLQTCHICGCELIVQEHPSYCEDGPCSADCEDHDGDACKTPHELHRELGVSLAAMDAARKEGEANFRLIVAAPDLLSALTALVEAYESMPDGILGRGLVNQHFLDGRAAIAKATEEPAK